MRVLRKAWIMVRLVFWYTVFWTFPTPEESLCIAKANCFAELGWYQRAIRNYTHALKGSTDPRIHSMIYYCYSQLGRQEDGTNHYRKAYEEKGDPRVGFGLAMAEFDSGNLEKSQKVLASIRQTKHRIDSFELDMLEAQLEVAKKEREEAKRIDDEFRKAGQ